LSLDSGKWMLEVAAKMLKKQDKELHTGTGGGGKGGEKRVDGSIVPGLRRGGTFL